MPRSNAAQDFVMPPGRMVGGSLWIAKTKDADGKLLTVKSGPNIGQPTQRFDFAVAYPKTQAGHWSHEPVWGATIWGCGNACFPTIAEGTEFSWKITDGDSSKKNKKGLGVAPNTLEGYPGHWILWFSSVFAPKVVNADGSSYMLEKGSVMPGDFIQVSTTVDGNESTRNPGVYLNHNAVRFLGYSADGRITSSGDALSTDWGAGPMPAKLSSAPVAGSSAPPAAAPPAYAPPAARPPALPGAPAPLPPAALPPTAVAPSPGFLAPPAALPPPPAMAPPVAAGPQMTAKAQGNTYEGLIAQGWTHALLVQHGMVTA